MDKIFEALSNNGFAMADYLVFVVYIIILVGMGLFLSRSKKGEEKSSCGCITHCCKHFCRTIHWYVWFGLRIRYRTGCLRVDGCCDPAGSG